MSKIIRSERLILDARTMLPVPRGTCDGGDCDRRAVSFAYDEHVHGLIPVCRRHILVYRVHPTRKARDAGRTMWQAEDEYAELRFARRASWRWLAQRRILRDQRAAVAGRESRAQRVRRIRADREIGGRAMTKYERCHIADGCGGDEACVALCPADDEIGGRDA